MRNYLYLILFLLLGTSSIAAQEPVATINGHTFHVGDSLTIGLPYQPEERYQNEPSKRYKTIRHPSWEDREIPAFTRGKLKWSIPTPKRNIFGNLIPQDTVYFLSLPKYPKDSLVVELARAIQKGEIITDPIEHTPLHPEAVELLPADYVPALIKAGYMTYSDVALKAYAQSLGDSESSPTSNPFEYQRQRANLLEKLKEAVEKFDLNRTYYARHQFTTEGYDFTRSGYPYGELYGSTLPYLSTPGNNKVSLYLTTQQRITFISVPAERAEIYEKRSGTLGNNAHTLYARVYFRLLPAESYTENDSHVYRTNINLLGLDAYEYPHCAYYHLGSGKAK